MAASLTSSGLVMPASQSASSNANTMDDYEEGTHQCVASSGGSVTSGESVIVYTKVGREVTLTGQVRQGTSQTSGNFALQGLPFTNAASPTNGSCLSVAAVRVWEQETVAAGDSVVANIEPGASTMQFFINRDNNSAISVQRDDQGYAAFSITYHAA